MLTLPSQPPPPNVLQITLLSLARVCVHGKLEIAAADTRSRCCAQPRGAGVSVGLRGGSKQLPSVYCAIHVMSPSTSFTTTTTASATASATAIATPVHVMRKGKGGKGRGKEEDVGATKGVALELAAITSVQCPRFVEEPAVHRTASRQSCE